MDPARRRAVVQGARTFRGWHHEPSLWREIYARTVSTLLAGFIAYLFGAWAGVLPWKPLTLALLILGLITQVVANGVLAYSDARDNEKGYGAFSSWADTKRWLKRLTFMLLALGVSFLLLRGYSLLNGGIKVPSWPLFILTGLAIVIPSWFGTWRGRREKAQRAAEHPEAAK